MSPSFQARDQARRAGRQAPDRCIRHRAMRTKFRVSCHAPGTSEYTLNPELRRKFQKWRQAVACYLTQSRRGLCTAAKVTSARKIRDRNLPKEQSIVLDITS